MRLGLSLSLSSVQSTAAVLDPATLALTGWWRTDFTAPWVGTASAGVSGTRNLSDASGHPPTNGTALNGKTPADFNGTDGRITAGVNMNVFAPGTGGAVAILFNADTAAAPGANAGIDAALMATVGGRRFAIAYTSSGIRADMYNGDGSTWTTSAHTACATGGWHWVFVSYDATHLYVQVDGGAVQTTTVTGTSTPDAFFMRLGCDFGAAHFFDGRIAEVMCRDSVWSAGDISGIISYGANRYSL